MHRTIVRFGVRFGVLSALSLTGCTFLVGEPSPGAPGGQHDLASCQRVSCGGAGPHCGLAPDGCGGMVVCGGCPTGLTCGGGGPNLCGTNPCNPTSCVALGPNACGTLSDLCGGVITCKPCTGPLPDLAAPPGSDLAVTPQPDLSVPGNRCPTVMLIFDNSGSMGSSPGNDGGVSTAKVEIVRASISPILTKFGSKLAFGLAEFDQGGALGACIDTAKILVEPAAGTASAITTQAASVAASGISNVGDTVTKVSTDPAMHDAARPQTSFAILMTDAEPNCQTTGEPTYTINAISTANTAQHVKTFVVMLGDFTMADPATSAAATDQMATAGGEPCSGSLCGGHKYYPVFTQQQMDHALDVIVSQIADANLNCVP